MFKNLTLCTVLALGFSSCESPLKTMKEMKETTQDMSNKMDTTNETTGQMNDGTTVMYYQFRSKESQETRDRNLRSMNDATSFEQKVTHSVAYQVAFEYQLWKNDPATGDDQHERETLYLRGLEEFFRAVRENSNHFDSLEDIQASSDENEAKNLAALAVALHRKHDFQLNLARTKGITEVSNLDLIKQSLAKSEQLEKGLISLHDLKDFEHEVLSYEPEAKMLMKLRLNMLTAMALSCVSDIAKAGTVKKAKYLMFDWDSKFPTLNLAQQDKVNTYLEEALSTQEFMASIGQNNLLDEKVKKIFKNMQLPEKACEGDACNNASEESLEKLKANLKSLLK